MKKSRFLKPCKICSKLFTTSAHIESLGKGKFCGVECLRKYNSIHFKEKFKNELMHPRWKGETVGYFGVHDWITKHFGQPTKCEHCGLDDPQRKYHWANLSQKYVRDIKDWIRMCVSCHRLYDYSFKALSKI